METDGANQRRQQQQQPQQQNQQQNQQNQPQQQQQPQNQQTLLPQNPLQQHQMEAENQQPTIEAMDTQDGDVVNESSIVMESLVNNEDANMQIAPQVDSTTMGMDATTTEPCVEEEVRSEATFQFEVENFSKLKESLLSPPCYVRKLPWKIMVMPRSDRSHPETKSLGFFLQCNAESESNSWSCNAVAELRLKSFKPDQEPFIRKIKHLFYSKENDWGFSYFMSWNEILDPEKGYVQNDKIVLEVHVTAEAPHGVFWDSKKHTGYVGLKNQGATCYMNSLLQTLYFTNQLRKAVYKMPTEADDSSKSVALALQRVFHELQFSDKPVGTKKLTKSFGWETLDSFMQHDVQEFLRVLLDKLESKMKGTCVEGTVPNLFEGKMTSYIKCKDVNYSSSRSETFYDIQLNIKGKKNISDSFADYIEPETLEGDNKYDAGDYGLQEAEKGVIFQSFPPVLHLHLMRFQYDPITDNSVKFNDRFEFDEEIELDKFLAKPEETEAKYRLHAVLVHSGDNHGGHYVVYINPLGDGKWCKFDDDVVSSCSKKEAIEQNYGGVEDDMSLNAKHCSNAYMLVYIRVSEMDEVLQKIEESDIPKELTERLHEEKRMETIRRRERAEASSYVLVHVVLEECLETHHSTDLFDLEKAHVRVFKMKKTETFGDLVATLEKSFRVPENRMRVWPLLLKGNVSRPIYFDNKDEYSQPLGNLVDPQTPWTVFLELAPPDTKEPLPPFDQKRDILLFFKFYDPYVKRLGYIGFGQFLLTQKFFELVPYINERLGFPLETELTIYEETGPSLVNKVNPNETLGSNLKGTREEVQGNILIFEKKHYDEKEEFELPTCDDYFRDLLYRIEVTFLDKCNPNDPGFILELSHRNTYDQMAQAVAQRIDTDPNKIQFFKSLGSNNRYKDLPGNPLRSVYEGSLKDILAYNKPRTGKKIFYQRLSMNLNELEDKKQYKCLWVSPNFKEEKELVLYPNKNGTVKTLLEEAAKQIPFAEDSTGKLRLVEVASHKLLQSFREDTALEHIVSNPESIATNQASPKFYRIEEIPASELGLTENEMLIPVCHFSKEIYNAFGIPFFIKAKYGEPFGALKERIRKRLNVPEKEWEKYKFAIITNRAEFISDDTIPVSLDSFRPNQPGNNPLPCLGLEHMNKSQKRSRYTYLEKAIKIYN